MAQWLLSQLAMTARRLRNPLALPFFLLPFCLTLSGAPAFAQGSTTRVEQDDPSVTFSGNWYSNDSAGHSRGVAALTNTGGARVTLTFTGTGITWVGVKDGWSGLATVHLDGAMTVVNSYADPAAYQTAVYRARSLAPGTHTLTIEVTHERGQKTEGSWVWIDAFDIENGAGVPGGSAVLAMDAGSRATINFNGTGINWMAYRDEWSGMARIYLDGELKTTIDNYKAPSQTRAVPYGINGLPPGKHALTIEVTGTRNQSSRGSLVWLDSFEVVP